tara:strand:+ start:95 stop:1183 length:1089 start_codon:yes stop_codon:yes gene_type:complete
VALSKLNNDSFDDTAVHGRRNLVINGAALIYQRGSSTTANLGAAADRIVQEATGGTSTLSRETLTSGSPYDEGFRFYNRLTNTAAASDAGNYRQIRYTFESQEIASSGWNYKSSSSFITWSFWIRASVAGKYTFTLQTSDGTAYLYTFSKTLSANTWTKVTEAIPGNSNLQFDNDTFGGLFLHFRAGLGSTYTNLSSEDAWATYNAANISTSGIANFMGTAGATYDVTGIQLELGDKATPFEHRSFDEELDLCHRYYQKSYADGTAVGTATSTGCNMDAVLSTGNTWRHTHSFPKAMRATPTQTFYVPETGTSGNGGFEGAGDTGKETISVAFATNKSSVYYNTAMDRTGYFMWHYELNAEL